MARDKEKRRAQSKRYYERNREREAARKKAQYWADPTKKRTYARKKMFEQRFGIPEERRDEMLAAQGGRCAICRTDKPAGNGWNFDHCHKTNTHRGVLCASCNMGLGMFSDNADTLRAAADYLDRNKVSAETTMKP